MIVMAKHDDGYDGSNGRWWATMVKAYGDERAQAVTDDDEEARVMSG